MLSTSRLWERRVLTALVLVGALVVLRPVIDAIVVFGFVALVVRVLHRAWVNPDGKSRESAGPTYLRLRSERCYIRHCAVVDDGTLEFELVAYGASFDGFDEHGAYQETSDEWDETVLSLRIEVDPDATGPWGFEEIAERWQHRFVHLSAETVVAEGNGSVRNRVPADLLSIHLDGGDELGTLSTTRTPS